MKYILIISLSILTSCISSIEKNNDAKLNIDIYQSDMTYEKFKQYAIDYAENASFPSLTNK